MPTAPSRSRRRPPGQRAFEYLDTDADHDASLVATVTLNVKVVPTIVWANQPDIVYGTPLSSAQLNATASIPGTFTYSPPAGTILRVGNGQTLSVVFRPYDTTVFTDASARPSSTLARPAAGFVRSQPTPSPAACGGKSAE